MGAPSGTITLVFTDIQGSTRLWEKLGNEFAPELERHNTLIRECCARHGGYEVKTEGDAFMLAFSDAVAALSFCMDAQCALHMAPWSPALEQMAEASTSGDGSFRGLRVRMGVHTGEPICERDPATGRMDYFGTMVNRAARIGSAAHGGQVLLSDAAYQALGGACAEVVTDHGDHRLKGLERPERLRSVLPPALAGRRFPPPATATQAQTNLPTAPTSFVGRESDISRLAALLRDGQTRLVTLFAPGGTGKTRLSQRVGAELLDDFAGGVWFADLSACASADDVAAAVALAFSVPLTTREEQVDVVGRVLAYRPPLLLILDNFEQVVRFAEGTVGRWRDAAPQVCFLVTSRFLLGLGGEKEFELGPLSAPPRIEPGRKATERFRARLAEYDAVKLFVERARLVRPGFDLAEDNAGAVAEICAYLEGMPLAIELAAARVKLMKPAQILGALGNRFDLLKSARRDLTSRQQTLRGAIEWSYTLLEPAETAALQQLVFFRGGFNLEAAERVLDLSACAGAPAVMDAVQALRDKSFVRAIETPLEVRFALYDSIREFAIEQRAPEPALFRRHAGHFAETAMEWGRQLTGPNAIQALDRLEVESGNLQLALDSLISSGQWIEAAGLGLEFSEVLRVRGPSNLRVPLLERVLEHAPAIPARLRARLTVALSRALQDAGRRDPASLLAQQALQLADDDLTRAFALCRLGLVRFTGGAFEEALALLQRAEQLSRAAGDEEGVARALASMVPVLRRLQRGKEALAAVEAAAAIEERRGHAAGVALNESNRANLLRSAGDNDGALRSMEKAERLYRQVGNRSGIALQIGNRGLVRLSMRHWDEAATDFSQAESMERELGNPSGAAINLGNRGIVLREQGRLDEALACYAEAERILRDSGTLLQEAANIACNAAAILLQKGDFIRMAEKANSARETYLRLGLSRTPYYLPIIAHCARAEFELGSARKAADLAAEGLNAASELKLDESAADAEVAGAIRNLRGLVRP